MAEGKTTFAELRNAVMRAKAKTAEIKEHGEEIAGAFLGTAGVAGGSASIGFVDELKGEVIENGIRMHKIGSLPTGLALGLGVEAAAALGAFGKMAAVGYAVGQGCVGSYANTMGRIAGARVREKSASGKVETKVETTAAVKRTGTGG